MADLSEDIEITRKLPVLSKEGEDDICSSGSGASNGTKHDSPPLPAGIREGEVKYLKGNSHFFIAALDYPETVDLIYD